MEGIGYFQNLRNLLRKCLEIFWEFFVGIFCENFFWRIFLGGILWEELLNAYPRTVQSFFHHLNFDIFFGFFLRGKTNSKSQYRNGCTCSRIRIGITL